MAIITINNTDGNQVSIAETAQNNIVVASNNTSNPIEITSGTVKNGTSGTSGEIGLSGSSGTSGTSGIDGTSGSSGTWKI